MCNVLQFLTLTYFSKRASISQGVIQAVVEIASRFWEHKKWGPNFDELAKKIAKPKFDTTESIHQTVTSEQTFYLFIRL